MRPFELYPPVTLITPTWERHNDLLRCLRSVWQQTYPHIEHLVISDGPDEELRHQLKSGLNPHYYELPKHMTTPETGPGVDAFRLGCELATSDFLFFLPDDDVLLPDAIDHLMAALLPNDKGFSYSQVAMYQPQDDIEAPPGWVCGEEPPLCGRITNFLFRKKLLTIRDYQYQRFIPDWVMLEAWLLAGTSYAFVPEILQKHVVNH